MNKKPVFTPAIQRVHIAYWTARLLVSQGVKRFYRVSVKEGFEKLPSDRVPVILVSNHQNGMMDALNICGLFSKQIHWLTSADIFWKTFPRMMMFGFNQMPIYRQRDRLADTRQRNDIIWDVCIERLDIGAALALFPEGNHNAQRNIRNLKRGVSDLLGKAVTKKADLKRIKLIPLGQDHEEYSSFRSRLSLRVGEEIEWFDLYDAETQTIDHKALNERIKNALADLTVDVRPKELYKELDPYVRALRTTEKEGDEWKATKAEIDVLADKAENGAWVEELKARFEKLKSVGYQEEMRPEAFGRNEKEVREPKVWANLLYPLAWVSNIPTLLQQFIIDKRGNKVKSKEFRSTMKVGAGMFLYPLSWTLLALGFGYAMSCIIPMWIGYFAFWSWATWGNKLYNWLIGHLHDHNDHLVGKNFWVKDSKLREAWKSYVEQVQS